MRKRDWGWHKNILYHN